jgi:FtsP/CotA-like multicopper oxidase with cupredoxin domain
MLHLPAGTSNTYTYDIPKDHPQGAYWYHSHLHMLTTAHVYFGMVGLLSIGGSTAACRSSPRSASRCAT